MRIKLYENRDFMRRTQIKLMQEEVHMSWGTLLVTAILR